MHEFYEQTRDSALFKLGAIAGYPVEDDLDAVNNAVAHVMKHGTCDEASKASSAKTMWIWAHLEIKAHASIKA